MMVTSEKSLRNLLEYKYSTNLIWYTTARGINKNGRNTEFMIMHYASVANCIDSQRRSKIADSEIDLLYEFILKNSAQCKF